MATAITLLAVMLGIPNIGSFLIERDQQYVETLVHHATPETIVEWRDFRATHFWFFGPGIPEPEPVAVVPKFRTNVGGAEQWRSLVATYFAPEDVDLALRVIVCESQGDPNAKNPHSSASGLFQHLGRFWTERSAAAGWAGADIFDPEANVAVAAWLRQDGWHHWNPSRHCWG